MKHLLKEVSSKQMSYLTGYENMTNAERETIFRAFKYDNVKKKYLLVDITLLNERLINKIAE